jgi:uncharacterized protein (DUF488 family)
MRVLTIGYEGIGLGDFLDVLQAQGVRRVVDVREMPLSRKPGFSKSALSKALAEVNIEYVHERVLGTPKPIREALRATGDWQAYERSYLEFLAPREEELSRILEFDDICLLCFEANYAECHRSLVTQRMEELNLVDDVRHLKPLKKKANPSLALSV